MIRVAPDILKLDRSLVNGVHDDPHRFALLEALISFASTTRAAVCAEGVETLDDLAVLAAIDVTYAQGWALARPDAPWAELSPAAASAASAEVRIGMRIARDPHDDAAPTLGDLIARLTTVSCVDDIRDVAAMIPAVLGGDDAAVSRVVPGEDCVEDISRHGWSMPGERYSLSEFPATEYVLRSRTAGQVVVGDPASEPVRGRAARAVGLPGGADGAARVRRPRRRAARALPPPRDAVEQRRDRARPAARAPARRRARPARARLRVAPPPERAPCRQTGRRHGDPGRRAARVPGRRAAVRGLVPHGDRRVVRGAARVRAAARAAARVVPARPLRPAGARPRGRRGARGRGGRDVGAAAADGGAARGAGAPAGARAVGGRLAARGRRAGGAALPAGRAGRDRRPAGRGEVDAAGARRRARAGARPGRDARRARAGALRGRRRWRRGVRTCGRRSLRAAARSRSPRRCATATGSASPARRPTPASRLTC